MRFVSNRNGWGIAALLVVSCGLAAWAVAPSAARKFTLIYNVNNAGYIDVCGCKHKEVRQGSITRRASFLKQIRATGRDLLLLDGGSSFFPVDERVKDTERAEAIRKAELIVEAYNRMGYRAMAVGSSDIAAGIDTLKALEKKAKFTFLSANFFENAESSDHKLIFTPHIIIEIGGLRVGILGLTLNTMSRAYLAKAAPNTMVGDPIEAAQKSLAELKGKTDLVIALSHIREETNFELIEKLKELEIVVDPCIQYGNHHTWLKDEAEWLVVKDGTMVFRSDGQGARMGVVDIELVEPRGKLVSADRLHQLDEAVKAGTAKPEEVAELEAGRGKNQFSLTRVSLEPHHRTDPEMDMLIEEWKKKIDPSTVARLEEQLPKRGEFLTVEKCGGCHQKVLAFWKETKHSHAWASLEETSDQHRFDCVGCHSLGYGQAFLDTSKVGAYANVQCESCHGTNPKHAEEPAKNHFSRVSKVDCIVCHNKEQTREEFNFAQARAKIQCPKG